MCAISGCYGGIASLTALQRYDGRMRLRWRVIIFSVVLVLAGPLWVAASGAVNLNSDWRTADRSSAGLAPDPSSNAEAVVQVYAARAFDWRGIFGVHTWIATKAQAASAYTVHEVLGWRLRQGGSVVDSRLDIPDRRWYGAEPWLVAERRGAAAAALIDDIEDAVERYPYGGQYRVWPGPNSNTFVAFVAREVPALGLALPATAIGKDYLPDGVLIASAPSGGGLQVSIAGLAGVLVAPAEGLEVNLLGLVFGLDLLRPALKLPAIGRIGLGSVAE